MEQESRFEQDARAARLWKRMVNGSDTTLDYDGLKAALTRLDHPLQDAEALMQEVFRTLDKKDSGHIDFEDFRHFVERAELRLWALFKDIDTKHNGFLDREELATAFERANIKISATKLDALFKDVDRNHDGSISWSEWRNFLILVPTEKATLKNIMSYYDKGFNLNQEGDSQLSDETVQSIGSAPLWYRLFGIFNFIARAGSQAARPSTRQTTRSFEFDPEGTSSESEASETKTFPWDPGRENTEHKTSLNMEEDVLLDDDEAESSTQSQNSLLTALLPHPGYFLAGGIAGAVSRTATAPLDRLKVYLIAQTSNTKTALDAAKDGSIFKAMRKAVTPLKNACVELWSMGGIRSLFAGNGLNVLKVMPESAIKFGSYEGAKRVMARFEGHGNPKGLSPGSQFFAAGMGGVIAQFCVYPLDTLKFRMQCETTKGGLQGSKLIVSVATKMWKQNGIRAYYRGLGMGLGGMFPYSALDLTTYEYLKKAIVTYNMRVYNVEEGDALPGQVMTGAIGATSSSFGASVVYPINMLRTRLQSQGTVIHPPTYTGWRDCLNKTIQGEGLKGLYRGLTPNLLKVVPSMSISYVVYETSKQFMGLK